MNLLCAMKCPELYLPHNQTTVRMITALSSTGVSWSFPLDSGFHNHTNPANTPSPSNPSNSENPQNKTGDTEASNGFRDAMSCTKGLQLHICIIIEAALYNL